MPKAYTNAALSARKLHDNRLTMLFLNMSNKFALSDAKEYAQRHVRKHREIELSL